MKGLITQVALCENWPSTIVVEGVATNYSFIRSHTKPKTTNVKFVSMVGENGWRIKVFGNTVGADFAEVGTGDGKVFTLLKSINQGVVTNAPTKSARGMKVSTAIIDPGPFPHTYWCAWATPIWFSLVSGVQLTNRQHSESMMEPLLVTEGNGDLLHNWSFSQKAYAEFDTAFPYVPKKVVWMHDGVLRDWVRAEDSWLFPPQTNRLGFPWQAGYTNAVFTTHQTTNLFGLKLPITASYVIHTRHLPSGFNKGDPTPFRVLQRFDIQIQMYRTKKPLGDFRPIVRNDIAFVKDNRFAVTKKITSVNYFQTNSWKTDSEILKLKGFERRTNEVRIVNKVAKIEGPKLRKSTRPKGRKKIWVFTFIVINSAFMYWLWLKFASRK